MQKEQKLSTAAAPFLAEFDRDMLAALHAANVELCFSPMPIINTGSVVARAQHVPITLKPDRAARKAPNSDGSPDPGPPLGSGPQQQPPPG